MFEAARVTSYDKFHRIGMLLCDGQNIPFYAEAFLVKDFVPAPGQVVMIERHPTMKRAMAIKQATAEEQRNFRDDFEKMPKAQTTMDELKEKLKQLRSHSPTPV